MARRQQLRRRGYLPQKLKAVHVVRNATALNVNPKRSALGNVFDCQCTPLTSPPQRGECERLNCRSENLSP